MVIQYFDMTIQLWQLFLSIGLILCIGELFIPGFVLLPIGLAFVLVVPTTTLFSSWPPILLILSLSLVVMFLLFTRLSKKLQSSSNIRTNADGMINQSCTVTQAIKKGSPGEVKVYGEQWTAVSDDDREYAVGEEVIIVAIKGNKLIINQ